jgi:uncharacterized protein YndB with AHSA1/START domain
MEQRTRRALAFALAASLAAAAARAETSGVTPGGFTSTFATVVEADPERVFQAFGQLPRWWSDSHTWSGKAANMSVDLHAGGCWCERWGEGHSVMHGQVVLVHPGAALRLNAALGPLQDRAISGVLTFGTARREGKTHLRVTYRVAGPADAGLDKLAPQVDAVLDAQVKRLKSFIETGRPDAPG